MNYKHQPAKTKIVIVWCRECLEHRKGDIFEVMDCRREWCENIDRRYVFQEVPLV